MTNELTELGKALEGKRIEWQDFYQKFQKVGDAQAVKMTGDDVDKFKALEAEVTDLQKDFDQRKSIHDAAAANAGAISQTRSDGGTSYIQQAKGVKTFTQQVCDDLVGKNKASLTGFAKEYKAENPMRILRGLDGMESKATVLTSSGYTPESLRDGVVVPAVLRPPQLIDFLPMIPTDQNSIVWMKETTHTSTATATAEGSGATESTYIWQEQTSPLVKIDAWVPASEEQLEDVAEVDYLIRNNLMGDLLRELDAQVTVGDGTGEDIIGIFGLSGIDSQTRASGEAVMDTAALAYKGLVVDGRCAPNLYVFHMTDYVEEVALAKTADGIYINGSPTGPLAMTLWGLPVCFSEALTAGNGLCLDTSFFPVKIRRGIRVETSNSHASNFIAGVIAFRAVMRAGLQARRDAAACKMLSL